MTVDIRERSQVSTRPPHFGRPTWFRFARHTRREIETDAIPPTGDHGSVRRVYLHEHRSRARTYRVNRDLHVDAATGGGLNERADDLFAGVGIAKRR